MEIYSRALGRIRAPRSVASVLLLLLASLTGVAGFEHEPRWHVAGEWKQPHGLAQNTVFSLLQTSDGYIWAGTKGGVSRFDGERFTTFDDRDGTQLRENEAWALVEGGDGSLWIGTYGGGLTRMHRGRFTTFTTGEGLANNFVTSLAKDSQGGIWAGTENGLSLWKDGVLTNFPGAALPGGRAVRTLHCAPDDTLWVVTTRNELLRGRNGVFTLEALPGEAAIADILALCTDRENALWLGTRRGLYRLHDGRITRFTMQEGLSDDRVNRLYVDAHGTLWIGAGPALDRFDHGRIRNELLSPYPINVITGDHEGSLWIGSSSEGIARLRRGQFRSYTTADGLRSAHVAATLQDRQGRIWLATFEGLHRFQDGRITTYAISSAPASNRLASLAEDRDGAIWIGTEAGLYRFRHDAADEAAPQFEAVPVPQVANVFARVIYEDRQGALWIGTNLEGLLRYRDGQFTLYTTRDGLGHDAVRGLGEDREGNLWIATKNGGLSRFADGQFTTFRQTDGLASDMAQALYIGRDNSVWVATRHGVSRRKDGRFINYTTRDGLYSNYVYSFCEDGHGNMWMTCAKGVFRVSSQQLDDFAAGRAASLDCVAYGLEHGLSSTTAVVAHHPAVFKTADGCIWFGTTRGVCVVNPASISMNELPPPVHIEGVSIDSRSFDLHQAIVAPPGRGDAAFRYTGLSFLAPEKVQFRYRLEGYDQDWIEAGSRREAYYNRVPPGRYTFQVRAANNDGVWSSEAEEILTIQPFFYQTWWFRSILAGAAALVPVVIFRRRVRQMRRHAAGLQLQNFELERRVAARTAELARSNETLRASEYFYQSLVESLPQVIARKDAAGRFTYVNAGFAELIERPVDEIVGRIDYELCPEKAAKHQADDARVMSTRQTIEYEELLERPDQKRRSLHIKKVPLVDAAGEAIGVQVLAWDMTTFRETEEKLRIAQRELVEASRLAGIAEVATGVLHNIGNALNSVNVSAGLAADRLRESKAPRLERVARLLLDQQDRLLEFYATDSRARHLPAYLSELAAALQNEQSVIGQELEALRASVNHIKDIVAAQQSFARVSGVTERVSAAELVEYALHISEASLSRHGINVTREFEETPPLTVPRQKVLQILVNLVRNAKEAVTESGRTDRNLGIRVRSCAPDRVQFLVQDNGVGIVRENLTRVFAFGFTTKQTGHGFGLHSSALAARELGGALAVTSDGEGCGATFTLELPCTPPTETARASEPAVVAGAL